MYDNDDEFGVDQFREDVERVYKMNAIKVQHYKRSKGENNPNDGDFLGMSSTEDMYSYSGEITINISSINLREREHRDSGESLTGIRLLECITTYNVDINNGDRIQFITNKPENNIKKGESFIVKLDDVGALKGQFCYKQFKAYSIGDIKDISEAI